MADRPAPTSVTNDSKTSIIAWRGAAAAVRSGNPAAGETWPSWRRACRNNECLSPKVAYTLLRLTPVCFAMSRIEVAR